MKFEVQFFSPIGNYAVSKKEENQAGLDLLDRAREEVGAKFHPALFSGIKASFGFDPTIEIAEEMARDCGHFKEKSVLIVRTSTGFCDQFLELELNCVRDQDNDAIKAVSFKHELNRNALEYAWMDAGYPLRWGFKDECNEPA